MRRLYQNYSDKRTNSYYLEMDTLGPNIASRVIVLLIVFCGVMLVLAGRLFQLQIVNGATMRAKSDNNRIYVHRLPAARGIIYDTQGTALVTNQPVHRLLTNHLGLLQLDSPIISREQALQIEATDSGRIIQSIGRYYPFGANIAHVVGYVAEADAQEVASDNIVSGDMTGKSGLERYYNSELSGQAGSELIELDAQGRLLRRVGQHEPQPGADIHLHLDASLQVFVNQALANYKGAVIVSQPKTGAIMALVSRPTYDPNVFGYELGDLGIDSDIDRNQAIVDYLNNPDRPMVNRAIGGTYPPGSVYKIVPSMAGLEEAAITAGTEIEDLGKITIDNYQFRNWFYTQYGGTDGMVNLSLALQRSNDIYYYKLGEMVGIDNLAKWSRMFGLGTPTGIDLLGEASGLVPDRLWKEQTVNERWYLGNTYHMSIGQGDLLTTPLQVNQMMAVIANDGRLCRPLLVKAIGDTQQKQAECVELGIEAEHIMAVKAGLIAACQPGGTGYPFFEFSLNKLDADRFGEDDFVACKTGTAQFNNPDGKTHAWFTIFAPAQNPEIMVTVLAEAAGEGSQQAAPVAKEILEFWFGGDSQLSSQSEPVNQTTFDSH